MQLNFNLKFENMKFGWETFEQVAHGRLSTNIPHCINNLHAPMPNVKKTQDEFKNKSYSLNIL
jgi:hypothetical protein